MRQVVKDRFQFWMLFQNRFQDGAIAAADIDERADTREIVGIEHCRCFGAVNSGHGVIENGGLLRMFGKVTEYRFSKDMIEGRPPSAQTVKQFSPRPIMLFARHQDKRPLRSRPAQQTFGKRCKPEAMLLILGEYTNTRQGAQ